MRAVAKITEGYFLALGNPSLLAKAIIGGALQEVSMEALMEEMRIEVEKESENLRNQNKEGIKIKNITSTCVCNERNGMTLIRPLTI